MKVSRYHCTVTHSCLLKERWWSHLPVKTSTEQHWRFTNLNFEQCRQIIMDFENKSLVFNSICLKCHHQPRQLSSEFCIHGMQINVWNLDGYNYQFRSNGLAFLMASFLPFLWYNNNYYYYKQSTPPSLSLDLMITIIQSCMT